MLQAEIAAQGGWVSFAHFMERVLYAPGLGYYAAGARKFGSAGDFVTAPEISSLFGQSLARAIGPILTATNGELLELGPGSAQLAFDLLSALEVSGSLPKRYLLLEVSADLRQRQQQRLSQLAPHLFARCVWIDALPQDFVGAIVANEVLDVVPVHLLRFQNGQVFTRGVVVQKGALNWQDRPGVPDDVRALLDTFDPTAVLREPNADYLTELSPQVGALVRAVMNSMREGICLWIDYGFRAAEYYHPSRVSGTLMCHYRHHAHTDPFLYPGLQDITAHVDFTAVAEAGRAAGGSLLGYTTQANFLLGCGITELIAAHDPGHAADYLPITNQAQRLLSPAEMGELFKVIGFSKGNHGLAALEAARQLPL
jgi:SAM-dependent MidA family methyltransferase